MRDGFRIMLEKVKAGRLTSEQVGAMKVAMQALIDFNGAVIDGRLSVEDLADVLRLATRAHPESLARTLEMALQALEIIAPDVNDATRN